MAKVRDGNIILTDEQSLVIDSITVLSKEKPGDNLGNATSADVGALFTGIENYLLKDGTTGPGGAINWAVDRPYTADISGVVHGGEFYICILTHTSSAVNEPGVGANWETNWKIRRNIEINGTPTADEIAIWFDANTIGHSTSLSGWDHQRRLTATAGHTFAIGEVGFLISAGTVTKAKADAESTVKNLLVMAKEAVTGGESGLFVLYGEVTVTGHGYAVGSPLFVSEITAGAITGTAPSVGDEYVRVIGYPLTENLILFNPSPDWIKVYVEPTP